MQWLYDTGYFEMLRTGDITQSKVARLGPYSQSSIGQGYAAGVEKLEIADKLQDWDKPWENSPPWGLDHLDELVDHFKDFRQRNFRTPDGNTYELPWHQERWIRATIRNMITGSKLMILSPPRHGKTDLFAHFDIWLVACINPNIRILTIGGSEDVSENSSGLAKAELENNENLINEYAPPGTRFEPPRSGPSWTSGDWTVNTRFIQSKSPTMKAVGRGGTILSRDADAIVADDIEDHKSTWTDTNREKTRKWWGNDVDSRKTGSTSINFIGSRQHPDDIMSYILEDPSWEKIVETIHDDTACPVMEEIGEEEAWHCNCDLEDLSRHGSDGHEEDCHFRQHTHQKDGGCMLWPDGPEGDERDFHFAASKRNNPHVNFKMTWQNEPQDSDITVFSRDLIRSCHDHRNTGDVPRFTRLIAGLDPSGSQYQAVFLWGFNPEENGRYAIDFDNQLGGGIKRAREQIREWFTEYGVRWWVIEENLYHGGIVEDELLRQFTQREGIRLEPHRTGTNKWDPEMGVSSLATWMEQGLIKIPNGSNKTAAKWREYERQLRNFSRETARSRKSRSDIVMASWFPEKRMKSWRREFMEGQRDQGTNLPSSYPFEDAGNIYDRMFS